MEVYCFALGSVSGWVGPLDPWGDLRSPWVTWDIVEAAGESGKYFDGL